MSAPDADAPRKIKTIVFVDDDRFFAETITEILTSKGYTVHAARDGLEALAAIRRVKPDCIILDMVLPKLDGGEVCAALRQDATFRHIPIIVFSSLSQKDFTFFPNISADAYVAKTSLAVASKNILAAISHVEVQDPKTMEGLVLGYDNLKSRRLVSELLLERRHLRAMFEVIVPGALELTLEGRIAMANRGACELLGKPAKQLVGKFLSSLLPDPDQKRLQDLLTDLGRSEQPTGCRTAFRFGTKPLQTRLAPILEERTCTGLVVILEGNVSTPAKGG